MTGRLAHFSVSYDGNESGDQDAVINAGSDKGFTVTQIQLSWEPHSMSGSSDELPHLGVARFASAASGGSAGTVFNYTDGDSPSASVLVSPVTLGSGRVNGPAVFPGEASFDGTAWYMHGGQYDWHLPPIVVAANGSFWVRATNSVTVTIHFHEHLIP
jgi:hypothetical protein